MTDDVPLKAMIREQGVHEHGKQHGHDDRPDPLAVVAHRHGPARLCGYRLKLGKLEGAVTLSGFLWRHPSYCP